MAGKRKILGLDIGRTTVKAVWAVSRGAAVAIARTETLRLPADTADRRTVIAPWLAKLGAEGRKGRTCAVGFSGQGAMFQPLVLMDGDPRTPQQVATMERYRFNELASEEMSFSFAPSQGAGGQRCVLLAMARPGLLDEAIGFAHDLGLQVVDLIPSAAALFNALAPAHDDAPGPVIYADVGHSGTELAVGTARGLLFARQFSVGGQAFTDSIARARKISAVQAESLKLAKGHMDSEDRDLAQALRKTADLWVSELMACLAVYASVFSQPADRPVRLVLCGGGSLLPGFAPYVGAKFALEVRVPASLSVGTPTSTVPSVYAGAAGLALGALGSGRTPLTLLPEVLRDEQIFRSQKPYWIAAGVVAGLILGVSVAGGLHDSQRKQKQLSAQEASLRHRQKLVQEIEELRARTETLRSMADPVRHLLGNASRLRAIVSAVALARDPADWITLVCDAESYYNPPAPSDAPGGRADDTRRLARGGRPGRGDDARQESAPLDHLIVEGYTRTVNLSTVQKMIEALKQVDFVASADLLSDDKLVPREESEDGLRRNRARRFVIDVKLKAP